MKTRITKRTVFFLQHLSFLIMLAGVLTVLQFWSESSTSYTDNSMLLAESSFIDSPAFGFSINNCNNDTENPTASNPPDIEVECLFEVPDPNPAVVTDEADNCGVDTVEWLHDVSDGGSNPEVITRTYRIKDSSDNFTDVEQIITVEDTEPPTASNPKSLNLACYEEIPQADPNVVTNGNDNCGVANISLILEDEEEDNHRKIITRIYRVSDFSGNYTDVEHNIYHFSPYGNPYAPPIEIQCLADIPEPDTSQILDVFETCGAISVEYGMDAPWSHNSFDRIYRVNFLNYGYVLINQIITVEDYTKKPTASDPQPIVVCGMLPQSNSEVVTDATDNCIVDSITMVKEVSDEMNNPETVTRTYRVADEVGNFVDVQHIITRYDSPELDPIDDVQLCGGLDFYALPAIQGSNLSGNEAYYSGPDGSGTEYTPEEAIITTSGTYYAYDDNGNCSDEVSFTITIGDIEPPTASIPEPIHVQCIGDVPDYDISVVTDEADNCGVDTVEWLHDVSDGGSNPEIITRTYRIKDSSDNFTDVEQIITVEDTEPPTASNPKSLNLDCYEEIPEVNPSMVIDADDNCGIANVSFFSETTQEFGSHKIITRTYRVSDFAENFIDVNHHISYNYPISNHLAPPIYVQCLDDIPEPDPSQILDIFEACGATSVEFDVDGPWNYNSFPRVYRVYYSNPNYPYEPVEQSIIVEDDTENPTASNPNPTMVCGTLPPSNSQVVNDMADNCGVENITMVNQVSDGQTDPETIIRTYRVTDTSENFVDVQHIITRYDSPELDPIDDVITCGESYPFPVIQGSNISDNVSYYSGPGGTGTQYNPGEAFTNTSGTYYAYDENSFCSDEQSFTVTIGDVEPPTASTPDPIFVQCIGDVPDYNILVVEDEADNCGVDNVEWLHDVSDGGSNPEIITRTYRIKDSSDNFVDVEQIITIEDTEVPTANELNNIYIFCHEEVPDYNTSVVTGETDNCGIASVVWVNDISEFPDDPYIAELITRTYRVIDVGGNAIDIEQRITINRHLGDTFDGPNHSQMPYVYVSCLEDIPEPDPMRVYDHYSNYPCYGVQNVSVREVTIFSQVLEPFVSHSYQVETSWGAQFIVNQSFYYEVDNENPTATDPMAIHVQCGDEVPAPNPLVVIDEADNCRVESVHYLGEVSDGNFDPETITRTYRVTDTSGNFIDVAHQITVDRFSITSSTENESCSGAEDGQMQLSIHGGVAPFTVRISTMPAAILNDNNYVVDGLSPGNYVVTVIDNNGCEASQTIQVEDGGPNLDAIVEPIYSCAESLPSSVLHIEMQDPTVSSDVLYALDSTDPNDHIIDPNFIDMSVGNHFLSILHTSGCIQTIAFEVADLIQLELSLSNTHINEITASTYGGTPPYTYVFNGEERSEPIFYIAESGTYEVRVIDSKGCETIENIAMEFIDIEIPNFFTPNNDGQYDLWKPKNIEYYPRMQTLIFDRYGRKIKAFGALDHGWDGNYKSSTLPASNYWYIIEMNDGTGRSYVGTFALYR
ncbi:T9SS type B sorting domain-containing protein [Flagellimonas hymeniacidonis]|nr:T9SS type B sorting domain-containing protein [Flagellimonas hymeniacidonis]